MTEPKLPTSSHPSDPVAACPVCAYGKTVDVFEIAALPINVGAFYETRAEALQAATGDITLAYCPVCEFVHNREFDPAKVSFEPGYEVALHHSATFRNFMEGVTARLIERFGLNRKRILEIGCGAAYFLQMLAEHGENDCIGIDPTVGQQGTRAAGQGQIHLIRDYFGPQHSNLETDFICCLSVFEDISQPRPFLEVVREIALRNNAPLYFEVFNAWRAFEQKEIWSVHYEQCNYFSQRSLAGTFQRHGFDVTEASTCYEGDQYLYVEAVATPSPPEKPLQTLELEIPPALESFTTAFSQKLEHWNQRFNQYRKDGERVVVWGTGGKGITFLNTVESSDWIQYVVEINPDKQGRFVPGSGQQIVPPEFLAQYQPSRIIITNALYEAEMKQQACELGVEAEFLIA